MGEQMVGDRALVDDRVTPLVAGDSLGKQLGAKSVRLARDRVQAHARAHCRPPPSIGTGSTAGFPQLGHGPSRWCSANSSANTARALNAKRTAPLGWWH